MPIVRGTRLGPYEITSLLGAGGMGEVYRAQDTRLGRNVAIKVLPAGVASEPERLRRFEQEARAEGLLNHPNVVTVHDVGTHGGTPYLVTELLEGESLRARLARGALPLREAVGVALQMARGLAAAHEKGIVHRDLKPDNVFLIPGGGVKILDFGIAKLFEPDPGTVAFSPEALAALCEAETQAHAATGWGVLIGTPAYMSPEQARGQRVDFRSDVFSFGIVLYEMLTGTDPFRRGNAADTLGAILKEVPLPVHPPGRRCPADLQKTLRLCLVKDPPQRYPSTRQLVADLEHLARRLDARLLTPGRIAAALVLIVATAGPLTWLARRPPVTPPRDRPAVSLLVADIDNRTGDPVFDGALEQALQIGLEGAPFVTAFDRAQASKQATTLGNPGPLDEARARLVSTRLGVKLIVASSIAEKDSRYTLQTRVVDPLTSQTLARVSAGARTRGDVLKAVDAVAVKLRAALGDVNPQSPLALGETFTTASLEALNSYARAQELHQQGKSDEAAEQYRQAIAQDPDFGRAYSGLAVILYNQGEADKAAEQFQKALALIDRMTERERYRTRGNYYILVHNHRKAIEEYQQLLERYPADTGGYNGLALAYFMARDMERALAQGRRGVEIYPKFIPLRSNLALYALYAGDFAAAEKEARAVLEQNATYLKAYVALALAKVGEERLDEARDAYRRLGGVSARGVSFASMGEADVALYEGRLSDAATLLEKGIESDVANDFGPAAGVKSVALARVRLAQGHRSAALAAVKAGLEHSRQPKVAYPAARVYLDAGQEREATVIAADLARSLDADAQAYGRLIDGEIDLKRGDGRKALGHFQEAKAIADTWLGRLSLARAYLETGALPEAHSELDLCLKRRGEAMAVFLDDVPSAWYLPPVTYYLARVQEGLGSAAASASYEAFETMKKAAEPIDPLVADARRRRPGTNR